MEPGQRQQVGPIIRFGAFELDPVRRTLSRAGINLKLQLQPMKALLLLVDRAPDIVTREQLADHIWGKTVHVELEQNLNYCIRQIRLILEDSASRPRFIGTLPRMGYRFLAPIAREPAALSTPPDPIPVAGRYTPSEPAASPVPLNSVAPRLLTRRALLPLGVAAGFAGGAFFLSRKLFPPARPRAVNVVLPLPQGALAADPARLLGPPVITPDGTAVVVALNTEAGTYLYLRRLDSMNLVRLEGTFDASYPFWSPDGQHLAFFAEAKLKRIPIDGGSVIVLCDASFPRGGAWSPKGLLLIALNGKALFQIPDSGGSLIPATQLDRQSGENSHRYPVFLPDGNRFLYFARADSLDHRGIYIGSLDGRQARRRILVADGLFTLARDPSTSHYRLLSQQAGKLVAQPFDLRTGALTGPSQTLLQDGGSMSASDTGVLILRTENEELQSRLVWLDRSGNQLSTLGQPGDYWSVDLSPDGHFAAISTHDGLSGHFRLALADLAEETVEPFSDAIHTASPFWSPDSKTVFYSEFRDKKLLRRAVSPRGPEIVERDAVPAERMLQTSADGRLATMEIFKSSARSESAWVDLKLDPQAKHFNLLGAPGVPGLKAAFSPDGKTLAFSSNLTGRAELYLTDFPAFANRRRISPAGGTAPRWRSNGKELFYLEADRNLMSVEILDPHTLRTAPAKKLFTRKIKLSTDQINYDVTADGQRFLLIEGGDQTRQSDIKLVLNWPSLLPA